MEASSTPQPKTVFRSRHCEHGFHGDCVANRVEHPFTHNPCVQCQCDCHEPQQKQPDWASPEYSVCAYSCTKFSENCISCLKNKLETAEAALTQARAQKSALMEAIEPFAHCDFGNKLLTFGQKLTAAHWERAARVYEQVKEKI